MLCIILHSEYYSRFLFKYFILPIYLIFFVGIFNLFNHPVTRFDVAGCIVSVHRSESNIKFQGIRWFLLVYQSLLMIETVILFII